MRRRIDEERERKSRENQKQIHIYYHQLSAQMISQVDQISDIGFAGYISILSAIECYIVCIEISCIHMHTYEGQSKVD